ncbi:FecR family protein [Chitinophaga ginsengisoli]|uniref:FecR family protein n=1 Tax=Chitinophaga ginsengisoli TaxID=363837 RepID=A0A2P8G584_9BACT|nr:FecR family protein [Chitinophaga ginsengisoli]
MQNQDQQISSLLRAAELTARYYTGVITAAEQEELQQWINAGEAHKKWFEAFGNNAHSENALKTIQSYDTERQLQAFLDRMKEKRTLRIRRTIFWAAACITLLLGSLLWILQPPAQEKTNIAAAPLKDREPGNKKATLILANGNHILLNAQGDSSFTQGNGTHIKLANGRISYQGGNNNALLAYNQLLTPAGGKYHIVLEDGTQVWLNAASSLRYPVHFSGKERRIQLSGEAYLEVAQNANRSFIVATDSTEVIVLGTTFNIRTYPRYDKTKTCNIQTTLVSGAVKVQHAGTNRLLQPGQTAIATGDAITVKPADIPAVTAWKNDLFVFRDVDLPVLMEEISRWYDVDVAYAQDYKPTHITLKVSRQVSLSKLLEMVELSGAAKFKWNDGRITVLPYHQR